jgi:hypothetical protein
MLIPVFYLILLAFVFVSHCFLRNVIEKYPFIYAALFIVYASACLIPIKYVWGGLWHGGMQVVIAILSLLIPWSIGALLFRFYHAQVSRGGEFKDGDE